MHDEAPSFTEAGQGEDPGRTVESAEFRRLNEAVHADPGMRRDFILQRSAPVEVQFPLGQLIGDRRKGLGETHAVLSLNILTDEQNSLRALGQRWAIEEDCWVGAIQALKDFFLGEAIPTRQATTRAARDHNGGELPLQRQAKPPPAEPLSQITPPVVIHQEADLPARRPHFVAERVERRTRPPGLEEHLWHGQA